MCREVTFAFFRFAFCWGRLLFTHFSAGGAQWTMLRRNIGHKRMGERGCRQVGHIFLVIGKAYSGRLTMMGQSSHRGGTIVSPWWDDCPIVVERDGK